MVTMAMIDSRYGLSEGKATEKGLRIDAQVSFLGVCVCVCWGYLEKREG